MGFLLGWECHPCESSVGLEMCMFINNMGIIIGIIKALNNSFPFCRFVSSSSISSTVASVSCGKNKENARERF